MRFAVNRQCGDSWNQVLLVARSWCFVLAFQPLGEEMASKKEGYKLTVAGPGHNFEREIDEMVASQIISLAMTGKVSGMAEPGSRVTGPSSQEAGSNAVSPGSTATQARGSLASYIKSKKAEKNQVRRFLVTAHWLLGRTTAALTASAVAKALLDNHQKRLANSADCLNKNVSKGFCEKTKGGAFFITPEGLETIESAAAE
jgi:hypothetical protein